MRSNFYRNPIMQGVAAAIFGAFFFSVMALFVRKCRDDYTMNELILVRAIFGTAVLSIICGKQLRRLFKKEAYTVWLRGIFGSLSVWCYYWNLQHTTLAVATVLTDLAPIFIALISIFFLGEKFHKATLLGVLFSIAGVALLNSPRISDFKGSVMAMGLASAFFGACAYLSLKKSTHKFSPMLIIWALSIILILSTLKDGHKIFIFTNHESWPYLIGVAFFSLIAQLCMTISYSLLPSTLASILSLTACIWAILFDIMIIKSPIKIEIPICIALLFIGIYNVQKGHFYSSKQMKMD